MSFWNWLKNRYSIRKLRVNVREIIPIILYWIGCVGTMLFGISGIIGLWVHTVTGIVLLLIALGFATVAHYGWYLEFGGRR